MNTPACAPTCRNFPTSKSRLEPFNAHTRKNGAFNEVPKTHDVTDELAGQDFPGNFGIFYKNTKPTKNAKEAEINKSYSDKFKGLKDWEILKKNFDKLK